jgi:hypothetical protein
MSPQAKQERDGRQQCTLTLWKGEGMKEAHHKKRGEIAVFSSARPDANVTMDKPRLPVQNSCRERSRMGRMSQIASIF